MATKYYLAIADRLPNEANWSITFTSRASPPSPKPSPA